MGVDYQLIIWLQEPDLPTRDKLVELLRGLLPSAEHKSIVPMKLSVAPLREGKSSHTRAPDETQLHEFKTVDALLQSPELLSGEFLLRMDFGPGTQYFLDLFEQEDWAFPLDDTDQGLCCQLRLMVCQESLLLNECYSDTLLEVCDASGRPVELWEGDWSFEEFKTLGPPARYTLHYRNGYSGREESLSVTSSRMRLVWDFEGASPEGCDVPHLTQSHLLLMERCLGKVALFGGWNT